MTKPAGITRDRKGREYRDLGPFGNARRVHVYSSAAAKGQRREESARVVLVGHVPELRVAVDPYRAKMLDRPAALLLLWARLVEAVDAKIAPESSAAEFEVLLVAEGLAVPDGPLHRPGLPKTARLILAYRESHPAASQRMVAAAVGCDPGRVCQVYRRYGDPAAVGAERRAECALNIQRGFSADSAREYAAKNAVSHGEKHGNGNAVPGADSAPPPCTSSLLRREDDGAPPPDAAEPRPALGGPPRPVVAGNAGNEPRPDAGRRPAQLPPGLEVVPDELRRVVWAVMTIEAAKPESATRWKIEQRVRKPDADLDRAVELGYLAEHGTTGARYWTPTHPALVDSVEAIRASRRSAAS